MWNILKTAGSWVAKARGRKLQFSGRQLQNFDRVYCVWVLRISKLSPNFP